MSQYNILKDKYFYTINSLNTDGLKESELSFSLLQPKDYKGYFNGEVPFFLSQKEELISLEFLKVSSPFMGSGKRAMNYFLAEAKKLSSEYIVFNACPMGEKHLNLSQLIAFYQKFGAIIYDKDEYGALMYIRLEK